MVTSPGLHVYKFEGNGGKVCLHLRLDPTGKGTLFIDARETVHLSETAAAMALLALEKTSLRQAVRKLRARFRGVGPAQLRRDYQRVQEAIRHLATPRCGCSTCGLNARQTPWFSDRPSAPYRADLALTYRCNNDCSHCYNDPERRRRGSLSVAEWRRVLDRLYLAGVPHVVFTGGEPTLSPALPDLVRYASQQGQLVGMNTNGRMLARAGVAEELTAAGLNHVQITVEAADPEVHNDMVGASAFTDTAAGIQAALAAGLHTVTNTTLTRKNAGSVVQLVEYLHDRGVATLAMNGMIYSGRGVHHPDALAPEELAPVLVNVRETAAELGMRFLWYTPTQYCRLSPLELDLGPKRCTAAEYAVCVEPDGALLPCQSWYEPVGNVLQDPWETLWNSALFRSFRDRVTRPTEFGLPAECATCPELGVCAGGCPLETAGGPGRQGRWVCLSG